MLSNRNKLTDLPSSSTKKKTTDVTAGARESCQARKSARKNGNAERCIEIKLNHFPRRQRNGEYSAREVAREESLVAVIQRLRAGSNLLACETRQHGRLVSCSPENKNQMRTCG